MHRLSCIGGLNQTAGPGNPVKQNYRTTNASETATHVQDQVFYSSGSPSAFNLGSLVCPHTPGRPTVRIVNTGDARSRC